MVRITKNTKDKIMNYESITCAALDENMEVISFHASVMEAKAVKEAEYIRRAYLDWYDATQPPIDLIQCNEAFRVDIDLDEITDPDYDDLEDYYPSILVETGNALVYCNV